VTCAKFFTCPSGYRCGNITAIDSSYNYYREGVCLSNAANCTDTAECIAQLVDISSEDCADRCSEVRFQDSESYVALFVLVISQPNAKHRRQYRVWSWEALVSNPGARCQSWAKGQTFLEHS
jgi:hypothetical protein